MATKIHRLCLLTATWLAACSSNRGGEDASNTSLTTNAETTETSDGETSDTAATTGTSGETGFDVKFDLGVIPDAPEQEEGCDKVDFLFIIDNSGSMQTSQENLIANFDDFITGIQQTLTDVDDYQVGIITTDKYEYNIPGCNTNLSHLVSQTGGLNSSMSTCGPYVEGHNFITEMDDLTQEFNCAAQVGTQGGGFELTMDTLVESVQEVYGGVGQCNEAFLRPDALLVAVLITDEADGPDDPEGMGYVNPQGGPTTSTGNPQIWFDDVVAARDGIEQNVVVLSLINYFEGMCPPLSEFFNGKNIKEFTEMFTNGFVGGICEPDYAPYFQEAIGVIEFACENYMPPK